VGFIWTAQAGMLDAMEWLKSQGHDLTHKMNIIELSAITGSGRVIAATSLDALPPHTLRSFLVRPATRGCIDAIEVHSASDCSGSRRAWPCRC
jgi:hypothetical protein